MPPDLETAMRAWIFDPLPRRSQTSEGDCEYQILWLRIFHGPAFILQEIKVVNTYNYSAHYFLEGLGHIKSKKKYCFFTASIVARFKNDAFRNICIVGVPP